MIRKSFINSLCVTAFTTLFVIMLTFTGCGKRVEAVITTEGEDITDVAKQYEELPVSKAEKFSYDDLKVGAVNHLMKEEQVTNLLGQPSQVFETRETDKTETDLQEKVYSYNDLTLVFTSIRNEYRLTAAAGVGDSEVFARGLSVGDTLDDILNVFYRDADCMNNYFFSPDKTAVLGKYLYGSHTIDSLDTMKIKNDIEYGVINYNGYTSLETAESYIVEFTCFKAPYKEEYATYNDAFAQMYFDMDNNGKITSIRWYYYPQID